MYSAIDPGLQPQRTALAWLRTTAVAWVVFLLHLRARLDQPISAQTSLVLCLWALLALGLTAQYLQRRKLLLESHDPVTVHCASLIGLSFLAFLSTFISALTL
ncbi:MAG: DUF202 domain-containing protein [Comamonas sp.]